MTTKDRIIQVIQNMKNIDQIDLWNEFCIKDKRLEDWIYPMYEFDEQLAGWSPTEIARKMTDGFNTTHDFFTIGIYDIDSFDWVENSCVYDAGEIADYCIRNWSGLQNDMIQEILDEEDEDDVA